MQRTANKIQVAMIVLLMGLLFYGCGSEDLLDENNQRYRTDIAFSDAEEEDTLTADIVFNADCNGDGVLDDGETFTDLFAKITIIIEDATTPGLEMNSYEISFRPLLNYDQAANPISPPSIGNYYGEYDVHIPALSEVEFWITCMEIDLKIYLGNQITALNNIFRYDVNVTMHFTDDLGEDRDISVTRTIYFGPYDNC
jgi:hypothetical protein